MSVEQYIKKIREANEKEQLVIFVGAGVSMNSGFPSWGKVIDAIKAELCGEGDKTYDFTKIAELYKLRFGEQLFNKKIQSLFPSNPTPHEIHKLIIDINPKYIITTNQDDLLEQAKNEQGKFYDVIVTDTELVNSELPNKIIKMHGDFEHNNIVFAESDYINYERNFPLIENYIKSILCTHTVLFLGYSYNDSTLKQINFWIKYHSKISPPMYMVTHECDYTDLESKYLENQGITSIIVGDKNKPDYEIPLEKLLKNITNDMKFPIQNINSNMLYDSVLEKLDILKPLNTIYYKLISESFSNIGINYDKGDNAYLWLYDNVSSSDQNMFIRKRYRQFLKIANTIVNQEENKHAKLFIPYVETVLSTLIQISQKSGIIGLTNTSIIGPSNERDITFVLKDIEETKTNFIDFDYKSSSTSNNTIQQKLHQLFNYYNLGMYIESIKLSQEIIKLANQQKQYIWAFIAMFNYNFLLRNFQGKIIREKVNNKEILNVEKPYNLHKIIMEYPKSIRKTIGAILKFLDFQYILSDVFSVTEALKGVKDKRSNIEKGGMSLSNSGVSYPYIHKNTLNFVLNNYILMEDYREFKLLNKTYLDISLNRQFQEEQTNLSNIEIYACLRYLDVEEIKELFMEFIPKDSSENIRAFLLKEDQAEWLLDIVWNNLVKYYDPMSEDTNFKYYIINYLTLISHFSLSDKQFIQMVHNIINFIISQKNEIWLFYNDIATSTLEFFNKQAKIVDPHKIYDDENSIRMYVEFAEKDRWDIPLRDTTGITFCLYPILTENCQTILKDHMLTWVNMQKLKNILDSEYYYDLLLRLEDLEIYELEEQQWSEILKYYSDYSSVTRPVPSNTVYALCHKLSSTSKYKEIAEQIVEQIEIEYDKDKDKNKGGKSDI